MADKELDKNQQEKDIDIDALFAKMMADKAASGEEIKQAEEEPEKAAPQPEAERYAVAENSQKTEEEPADDMGTEEAPVETEPAETVESAEAEDTDEEEQPIPEITAMLCGATPSSAIALCKEFRKAWSPHPGHQRG